MPGLSKEHVDQALTSVRALVQADGGDIVTTQVDENSATLQLVLEGAECRECVMPRDFLEKVALDMMKPELPGLESITILDPREES